MKKGAPQARFFWGRAQRALFFAVINNFVPLWGKKAKLWKQQ